MAPEVTVASGTTPVAAGGTVGTPVYNPVRSQYLDSSLFGCYGMGGALGCMPYGGMGIGGFGTPEMVQRGVDNAKAWTQGGLEIQGMTMEGQYALSTQGSDLGANLTMKQDANAGVTTSIDSQILESLKEVKRLVKSKELGQAMQKYDEICEKFGKYLAPEVENADGRVDGKNAVRDKLLAIYQTIEDSEANQTSLTDDLRNYGGSYMDEGYYQASGNGNLSARQAIEHVTGTKQSEPDLGQKFVRGIGKAWGWFTSLF